MHGIHWNRDRVYRFFAAPPIGWTQREVDQRLFARYDSDKTYSGRVDPQSIMLFPIPEEFTIDGFEVGWNRRLSAQDKEFIHRCYPLGWEGPAHFSDFKSLSTGGNLESVVISKGSTGAYGTPAADPVVLLRLEVAVPDKVLLGRPFVVAVAVRQPASPPLSEADLPVVRSGPAQVVWLENQPYVRLHIEVVAPECEIDEPNPQSLRLYRGQDSIPVYFGLTPRSLGLISIVVVLRQEEDALGSARASTRVRKQRAGKVKVEVRSEPLTNGAPDFTATDTGRAARRAELAQHRRNLALLRQKQAVYAQGEAPLYLLNQLEHEEQVIERIQAELARRS
jgi:hypothetical protein